MFLLTARRWNVQQSGFYEKLRESRKTGFAYTFPGNDHLCKTSTNYLRARAPHSFYSLR